MLYTHNIFCKASIFILCAVFYPAHAQEFFPENAFTSSRMAKWYSKHLIGLEERPIVNEDRAYRYTLFRSFRKPVAIRVMVLNNGEGLLHLKMSDASSGYFFNLSKVLMNEKVELDSDQVRLLENKFSECRFWDTPTDQPPKQILDGARWVIEGSRSKKYHVIHRSFPGPGCISELSKLFVTMSEFEIKEKGLFKK